MLLDMNSLLDPLGWAHVASAGVPAFLASLVEFVEASTIVLAVGVTRGWRAALLGPLGGVAFLAILILAFGPGLARVPLASLQLAIGILLLLFGLRWLRKAILRAGGVIDVRDEARIFAHQRAALGGNGGAGFDVLGFVASFKAVTLEGLEVVFIVIAVGTTSGALIPAAAGAGIAGLLVAGAAALARRPLARVPENTLKFAVGVLLSAFGTFWTGEALGVRWPAADLSLVFLVLAYALTALAGVASVRTSAVREAATK